MELPKHTTQVGTIAANKKLYLEDYCISYMKQLCETYPQERKQIALFGTVEREKGIEYALVYGAALLGRGRGRTDSLTSSQKEEAESFRTEFFEEYQLVGVVISTDLVNENIYWLGNGNKSIQMDGYYIFYDTNEAMLSFMMKNQSEERDIDLDPVIVKKADMDREKRERAEQTRQEALQKKGTYRKKIQSVEKASAGKKQKGFNPFPVAACLLLLGICGVYGVKTYYPEFGFQQLKEYVSGLWGDTNVLSDSYLSEQESQMLLVEQESLETFGSTEETGESMVIVSADVEQPAELDVVVIPELDGVTDSSGAEENNSESSSVDGSVPATDPVTEKEPEATTEPDQTDSTDSSEEKPEAQEYLIKKGDNLLRILRAYYGDESKLKEICAVNGIVDPNNIQVGQTILLP